MIMEIPSCPKCGREGRSDLCDDCFFRINHLNAVRQLSPPIVPETPALKKGDVYYEIPVGGCGVRRICGEDIHDRGGKGWMLAFLGFLLFIAACG